MNMIDVLRVRLGMDPPANVPPMKVEIDSGAKPVWLNNEDIALSKGLL